MDLTKRCFTQDSDACRVAYAQVKDYVLDPDLIYKLQRTGTTSNLESFHSSLHHKSLLDKDKNPQVKRSK